MWLFSMYQPTDRSTKTFFPRNGKERDVATCGLSYLRRQPLASLRWLTCPGLSIGQAAIQDAQASCVHFVFIPLQANTFLCVCGKGLKTIWLGLCGIICGLFISSIRLSLRKRKLSNIKATSMKTTSDSGRPRHHSLCLSYKESISVN